MEWPSAWTANIKHERADSPSNRMVQAPQTPCSQPTCVPVRPSSWRRKSLSNKRASTSRVYVFSLTVMLTGNVRVIGLLLLRAALLSSVLSLSAHLPNGVGTLLTREHSQTD